MTPPSNIPKELAESKSAGLKMDPADPETARLVKEFVAEQQAVEAGQEPSLDVKENTEVKPPQVNIPPNPEFSEGDAGNNFINQILPNQVNVEVTDQEKEMFLKAVLADEPIRLQVTLYNGKFKVDLRSRSTHEQKRVFDAINADKTESVVSPDDVGRAVTRFQYYLASLMVERINDELISELKLPPDGKVADQISQLRQVADAKFETMQGLRWNSLLTALNIFELKCSKLNSEAANEGFWNPHGSA